MDQETGSVVIIDTVEEVDFDDEMDPEIEQTQAEIEQTRAQMSDTLEAIREKLNPQMLMQQAKETVHGVTSDLAQQAKETVHAVTSDVVQQAKENLPQVSANVAHQAVHGAVTEAKEAVGSAVNSAKEAMGSVANSAKEAVGGAVVTAKEAGSTVVETIERNPLPTALVAMGLGWYWMNTRRQYDGSSYRYRDGGEATNRATQAVSGAVDAAKEAPALLSTRREVW